MNPTLEQQEGTDVFMTGANMKVNAYAGAGKTSTLELFARARSSPGIYLCFNKPIAEAAGKRFPESVACKTTHSFAYRSVIGKYRTSFREKMTGALRARDTADFLKLKNFPIFGGTDYIEPSTLGYAVNQTVRKFCMSDEPEMLGQHFAAIPKFQTLPDDEFRNLRSYVLLAAKDLWEEMTDPEGMMPLGHDGYVKVWQLSTPVIDTCYILVDEAQDTNPVMLDVLKRQEAQVVYVGDKHQQIYEWRGAVNAMETVPVIKTVNLTKSFRFGQDIADFASDVLSKIGETNRITGNENIQSRLVREGQKTILCRTNGQILDTVLNVFETTPGKPIHVVGGVTDLANCLDGIERLQQKRPSAYSMFLGFKDWNEFLLYSKSSGDEDTKKIVKLTEKYGIPELKSALHAVRPSESGAEMLLTTAHKAKGREWPGVELAEDFKAQPEKDADNNLVHNPSETRLFYVAATRAINNLKVPTWAMDTYAANVRPLQVEQSTAESNPL